MQITIILMVGYSLKPVQRYEERAIHVWGSARPIRVTDKSIPSLWRDKHPAIEGLWPPEHHSGQFHPDQKQTPPSQNKQTTITELLFGPNQGEEEEDRWDPVKLGLSYIDLTPACDLPIQARRPHPSARPPARVPGCLLACLPACLLARLPSCLLACLPGCLLARLPGCRPCGPGCPGWPGALAARLALVISVLFVFMIICLNVFNIRNSISLISFGFFMNQQCYNSFSFLMVHLPGRPASRSPCAS